MNKSRLLLHLASHAPLALVVHSGIKSIHGWFYCIGQPEEKLRSFMRYAVSLGAETRDVDTFAIRADARWPA